MVTVSDHCYLICMGTCGLSAPPQFSCNSVKDSCAMLSMQSIYNRAAILTKQKKYLQLF